MSRSCWCLLKVARHVTCSWFINVISSSLHQKRKNKLTTNNPEEASCLSGRAVLPCATSPAGFTPCLHAALPRTCKEREPCCWALRAWAGSTPNHSTAGPYDTAGPGDTARPGDTATLGSTAGPGDTARSGDSTGLGCGSDLAGPCQVHEQHQAQPPLVGGLVCFGK